MTNSGFKPYEILGADKTISLAGPEKRNLYGSITEVMFIEEERAKELYGRLQMRIDSLQKKPGTGNSSSAGNKSIPVGESGVDKTEG
jgi:hypothetical protein